MYLIPSGGIFRVDREEWYYCGVRYQGAVVLSRKPDYNRKRRITPFKMLG